MALDNKYGRVMLEHGTIGEDEPVFVFRAQDQLLPDVLDAYLDFCVKAGSPSSHLAGIELARDNVLQWQGEHYVQLPRSDSH